MINPYKRIAIVAFVLLFGLLVIPVTNVKAENQNPPWNGGSGIGQWLGDKFKESGEPINDYVKHKFPQQPTKPTLIHPQQEVEGDKMIDQLLPNTKEKIGNIPLLTQKYPISHYQLDFVPTKVHAWNIAGHLSNLFTSYFHEFNNSIWILNVFFSRFMVWILQNALELDMANEIGSAISEGLKRLAGMDGINLSNRGIYGLFFPLMIVISGIWIGWRVMVQGDEDGAIRGIVSMVVMILFSFAFFYHSKSIILTTNQASSEVTKGIMAVSSNLLQPNDKALSGDESSAVAQNNLWNIMVHKPYLLLQFGTTQVSQKRVHKLLSLSHLPYQDSERTNRVILETSEKFEGGYGNTNMTAQNNGYRFLFLVFLSLFNLMIGIIMIFFSLGMIGYQLYLMLIFLLAPIALAWAIVPAWQNIAFAWISEALRAILMKLAWGILLAMLFAFSTALYDFTEDKNYLLMMLLQWALVIVLFWKRKSIFQIVTSPVQYLTSNGSGFNMQGKDILNKLWLRDIESLIYQSTTGSYKAKTASQPQSGRNSTKADVKYDSMQVEISNENDDEIEDFSDSRYRTFGSYYHEDWDELEAKMDEDG